VKRKREMIRLIKQFIVAVLLVASSTTTIFANYRDQMDLAKDAIFVQRVKLAMINTAITVSNESTGTANHAARTMLAKACLNSPDSWAQIFAVGVAADSINFPAVITRDGQGNITGSNGATAGVDAGIDGRLLNIWNNYAGLP